MKKQSKAIITIISVLIASLLLLASFEALGIPQLVIENGTRWTDSPFRDPDFDEEEPPIDDPGDLPDPGEGFDQEFLEMLLSTEGGNGEEIPLFELFGVPGEEYVRLETGAIYGGHDSWEPLDQDLTPYIEGEELPQTVPDEYVTDKREVTVNPHISFDDRIPVFSDTVSIEGIQELAYFPGRDSFITGEELDEEYLVKFLNTEIPEEDLKELDLDFDVEEEYMEFPELPTDRVQNLAQNIVEGEETSYEKAKAIETYLKNNYEYDPDYERAPSEEDPVEWFLFEEEKGVCSNFNSAFVLLSRSIDIPARVVGGYAADSWAGSQMIQGDQAHMWAEVPFENVGWVEFDATPPGHDGEVPDPGFDDENEVDFENFVSTEVNVFYYSEEVVLGDGFEVSGEVVTENGNPVPGLQVLAYLVPEAGFEDIPPMGSSTTDNRGFFDFEFGLPDDLNVGEHEVFVEVLPQGRFEASRSEGHDVKIFAETDINLGLPAIAMVDEPFFVEGVLLKEPGGDGLGSEVIELKVDGDVYEVVTDEDGEFSLESSFDSTGNYLIEAHFAGSEFLFSSESQEVLEVTDFFADFEDKDRLVRGEFAQVLGETSLSGVEVEIVLDDRVVLESETGEDGVFEDEFVVPRDVPLGSQELIYRIPDVSFEFSQDVDVFARPKFNPPEGSEVHPGDNVVIETRILTDENVPISGMEVLVDYPFGEQSLTTGEDGEIYYSFRVPENFDEDSFTVDLEFPEQDYYLSTSKSMTFSVLLEDDSVFSFWILLPIFAVLGIVGGAYLAKRGDVEKDVEVKSQDTSLEESDTVMDSIGNIFEIRFSEIEDFLPNVWGVDEDLTVEILPADGDFADNLEVFVDSEKVDEFEGSSFDGYSFERSFDSKGVYTISVESGGDILSRENLRVVDYREEVIDLFNDLFVKFGEDVSEISRETTPREFKRKIEDELRMEKGDLDNFVKIFEIADYSEHEIDREHYEKFYPIYDKIMWEIEGYEE